MATVTPPATPSSGSHGPLAYDDLSIFDLKGREVRAIDLDVEIYIQGGLTVRADGKVAVVAAEAPSIMTEPSDLLEVDLDTGRTRPLLSTPDIDESEPVFVGAQIAMEEWPRIDADRRPGYVSLFDPSTGRVERRTPDGVSVFGFAASRDGRFFVLDASTHGRQDRMYRAIPTEGGELVPLHDGAGAFALHPDGTRLVIATTNAPYRLYTVDMSGPGGGRVGERGASRGAPPSRSKPAAAWTPPAEPGTKIEVSVFANGTRGMGDRLHPTTPLR